MVAEAGNQELVPDFVKTLLEKLSQMVKEFGGASRLRHD